MAAITIEHFGAYFEELHYQRPYPWQERLASSAVSGRWPGAIDLPTGSGKTACLDVAIFALACDAALPVERRTAPRRVFFCVNRRVIVDEACERAKRIASAIWRAERDAGAGKPVLRQVAAALRDIAGTDAQDDGPPLDVLELRGGIYRDNRWARSITQPTIICTTLDQLGSRLLFRGYGVSSNAAPIQAALIAYDSLLLLDEAHISEPFRQTIEHVSRYLDPEKWAEEPTGIRPMVFVPMTATPNDAMRQRGVIELEAGDRAVESLNDRLTASKSAELRQVDDLVTAAVQAAMELAAGRPAAVGIVVNRVATARGVYEQLCQRLVGHGSKKDKISSGATVELVIGSMRPIDRDQQAERLRALVGPDRPRPYSTQTSFVVATQCLEVGADYDFDALVTECASLDALRQRFGRLNRAGRKDNEGHPVSAKAVILAEKSNIKAEDKLDDTKPLDPIYGNALARTWNWLKEHASNNVIDFGIDAFDLLLTEHGENGEPPKRLFAPAASLNAPVMLPAYVDFWCQTAPQPAPDPDVSLFIHGPMGGEPDVQVCWRADLDSNPIGPANWCNVVALLPPTSAECMRVPISRVRRWLASERDADTSGDMVSLAVGDDANGSGKVRGEICPAVLWRGAQESRCLESLYDLRPGDTLVLPVSAAGSSLLGHLPELPVHGDEGSKPGVVSPVSDYAETAFLRARDRAALRVHPSLKYRMPDTPAVRELCSKAALHCTEPITADEWRALLSSAIPDLAEHAAEPEKMRTALQHLVKYGLHIEPYPDGCGVVLISRKRLGATTDWFVPCLDDGDDETSRVERDQPVRLDNHANHVLESVEAILRRLPLGNQRELFCLAAKWHDMGKADERFQAMFRRTDRTDAWLLAIAASALLAKSDGMPQTPAQRGEARARAGLPEGFRHEMLSIQLAEHHGNLPADEASRDLVLHLIAAHHGFARPFAPVVPDDELPAIDANGIALSHEQRKSLIPPHRLDSGVPERFWRLTRRFGWWGLAFLEAVLRLADQQASAAEDTAGNRDDEVGQFKQLAETTT